MHLSSATWVAAGVVAAAVIGAIILIVRPIDRKHDLGAVSAGWIAEHNSRKSDGAA